MYRAQGKFGGSVAKGDKLRLIWRHEVAIA